ncbi:MAG: trehalose-phosphatase [Candidatus Omnitrophica bacterium]|nr:Trehalose-phosphate phosphatase [bacterium]NUN95764.1 trehalose-phosphatase [Candidatus Omnitrophota bacterium]
MPPKLTNNYTSETRNQIKQADLVILICGYDGILVPHVQPGDEIHMAETVHEHLEKISQIPSVRLGVISGRSLLDMQTQLPMPGIHYFCNHGLEIQGPDLNFHHSGAEQLRPAVHEAANTLRIQLRVDRIVVEDRGLSAALNYRAVMENQISSLLPKARNLLASLVRERKIRIEEGRRTLEILPAIDWDRGKAVRMLHQTYRALYPDRKIVLLYVGDDAMDEPAFKFSLETGIPYRVTQTRQTDARYYLKMQTEISRVLKLVREHAPARELEPARERMVL